jgi:5-formyltetrahydrofolate cyclo-ligase
LSTKQELREQIWDRLTEAGAARFPGARGRIPNFAGAEAAAARLAELDVWRSARVLKCNPDSPQRPVRARALREGKILYVAVPRLREPHPFLELDPARLRDELGDDVGRAATIEGAARYGRPVAIDEMAPVDLIVSGAVAVTRDGARLGKGGGYADLEFALAREAGLVGPDTPVVTTVHPLQIVPGGIPLTRHDVGLDYVVTPDEVIVTHRRGDQPAGIYWDELSQTKIAAIPVLAALQKSGEPPHS